MAKAKTKYVSLEGTMSLTVTQAEALIRAAESTLERDSWEKTGDRSLTERQTQSVRQALEKLLTAIAWQEEER